MSEKISDEELHPLVDAEIERVPQQAGVYMLWQGQTLVDADWDSNLRSRILTKRGRFPGATHFSLDMRYSDEASLEGLAANIRREYGLDRKPGIGFSK